MHPNAPECTRFGPRINYLLNPAIVPPSPVAIIAFHPVESDPFYFPLDPLYFPDWLNWVNEPQTDKEMAALRCSVQRGQPFAAADWREKTAMQLA